MHSDHYMVEIKLAAHKMTDCSKVPKYKNPNASQWQNHNDSFASLFASSPPRNSEFWKSFNGAICTAARNCSSKETPKGKKCYISQSTWNLIDRRQALHIAGKHDEVVHLDKQIKRNARADRKQHLVTQFQHNPADPHRKQLWKAVVWQRKCKQAKWDWVKQRTKDLHNQHLRVWYPSAALSIYHYHVSLPDGILRPLLRFQSFNSQSSSIISKSKIGNWNHGSLSNIEDDIPNHLKIISKSSNTHGFPRISSIRFEGSARDAWQIIQADPGITQIGQARRPCRFLRWFLKGWVQLWKQQQKMRGFHWFHQSSATMVDFTCGTPQFGVVSPTKMGFHQS